MQTLDYFHLYQDVRPIAEGVILPSGLFAVSWWGAAHSHGVFPRFEVFKGIQGQRHGRSIKPVVLAGAAASKQFYLQRHEDWSGISGTGVVAVGFEFNQFVVLHWLDADGSTFWYESVAMVEQVHGHEGRTQIVRCGTLEHQDPLGAVAALAD